MKLNNLTKMLLDIVYPKRCPICMELIPINQEERICETCIEELPYIQQPRCHKCSKPVSAEDEIYCFDCIKSDHYYTKGWAVWLYERAVKDAMHRFKYNNNKNYGRILSKEVVTLYSREIYEANIDLIIPIPLYRKKEKKRGYNQAGVIATYIGKYTSIPCNHNCIIKKINTKAQKNLTDKERIANVKNIFKVTDENLIKGKNILLCDDIYTTGSTIDSCAKELLSCGAKEIYFITLAIGKGF